MDCGVNCRVIDSLLRPSRSELLTIRQWRLLLLASLQESAELQQECAQLEAAAVAAQQAAGEQRQGSIAAAAACLAAAESMQAAVQLQAAATAECGQQAPHLRRAGQQQR